MVDLGRRGVEPESTPGMVLRKMRRSDVEVVGVQVVRWISASRTDRPAQIWEGLHCDVNRRLNARNVQREGHLDM